MATGSHAHSTLTAPRCGSRELDTSCRGDGVRCEGRTAVGGLGEDKGVAGRTDAAAWPFEAVPASMLATVIECSIARSRALNVERRASSVVV